MEGRSLAFADPNSTSGYLVPSFELASEEGLDLETYFSETGFGGGHEQAVVAVLNGQYDAGVTWTSGVGDINMGYSRGNLRSMVDKDMLDMSEIQIIWQSNLITNGPRVIRADLPQELKDLVMGAMMQLQVADRTASTRSTTASRWATGRSTTSSTSRSSTCAASWLARAEPARRHGADARHRPRDPFSGPAHGGERWPEPRPIEPSVTPHQGAPMLKLDKLTRRFGDNLAVNNANLTIPDGQMVGIIGRSGAGKSTLLRF
jgi:ABC-type multidrug transport system fused ATPase/permease subunit